MCMCTDYPIQEWIGDTGSTHHVTKSEKSLYNIRNTDATIIVGDGTIVKYYLEGDLDLDFNNSDNNKVEMTLLKCYIYTQILV